LWIFGVDQARAVDELTLAGDEGIIKLRKVLGVDAKIGVQDHKNVPTSFGESQSDSVAFTTSLLNKNLNIFVCRTGRYSLTLRKGVIFGMPFNKDELSVGTHERQPVHQLLDVAFLVTAWTNHGDGWLGVKWF